MDVTEPIEPKASNGHRFILVAIDYFTKWVEVASYKSVTKQAVVKFIRKVVLPIEVELSSLRIVKEVELKKAEWTQARYERLYLTEDRWLTALCRGQLYQKKMTRAYDRKI
ncbi:uncharacterized protein E6C27_scaffold73G00280 [Cucumis melo var. makuwa]|uniref:Pol polyprotein n=1 Tax=Cucumis melo var. makuwa TaxID=1194695 RepID=A0A5A7UNP8_CUCMM|nr:uncharacterized protein E6C27_scaffold73G00280 [Cucumis melo var. makuwa]